MTYNNKRTTEERKRERETKQHTIMNKNIDALVHIILNFTYVYEWIKKEKRHATTIYSNNNNKKIKA
jgi:hypothetical protein